MTFDSSENKYPPWATVPQEKSGWIVTLYSCWPRDSTTEASPKVVGGRDMFVGQAMEGIVSDVIMWISHLYNH